MLGKQNRAFTRILHCTVLIILLVSCTPSYIDSSEGVNFHRTNTNSPTETRSPSGTQVPEASSTITISPISTVTSTLHVSEPANTPTSNIRPISLVTLGNYDPYGPSGAPEFSPDYKYIALAYDGISIWDAETYDLIFEDDIPYENYFATSLSISSDADLVAASFICWPTRYDCRDQHVAHLMIWELSSRELIHDWSLSQAIMKDQTYDYFISVYGLSFKPETNLLAFSNGNAIEIREVSNDNEVAKLDLGEDMYGTEISFSEDGKHLIVMMEWIKDRGFASEYAFEYRVQVWDTINYQLLNDIEYPEAGWYEEDMSLIGSYLAHTDKVNAVFTITDLLTEEITLVPYRRGYSFVSPDRSIVAFARYGFGFEYEEKGIELWDSDTWREIYHFKPYYMTNVYSRTDISLDISPDNTKMLIAHEGQISIWDIRSDENP